MSNTLLLRCLGYCKRGVSVAILFSSLICSSAAAARDNITNPDIHTPSVILTVPTDRSQETMYSGYAVTDPPVYTITNNTDKLVPPGTYSNVVFADGFTPSAAPKINYAEGTVTLTGGPDVMLMPALSTQASTERRDDIHINSAKGDATLVLQEGKVVGDIFLYSHTNGYTSKLLIGTEDGSSTGGTVELTSRIGGSNRTLESTSKGNSVVQTNGSDLVVHGALGGGDTGLIEARNGNITVDADSSVKHGDGTLQAIKVVAREGMIIDVGQRVQTYQLFLYDNATLNTHGEAEQSKTEGGRIDIMNAIDGAQGLLSPGSKLISDKDNIFFWQGVTQGSGEISAGSSIATHQGLATTSPATETMLYPLSQGPNGSLKVSAGADIMAGEVNVESLVSTGGDIMVGSELPSNATDVIAINHGHMNGSFAPRGVINAKEITAAQGGIYAGEINASGGEPTQVAAKNIILVKRDGTGDLPASTGNLNITDGTFSFTGGSLGAIKELDLTESFKSPGEDGSKSPSSYAAVIEGDLIAKNNGDSTLTTMKVFGASNITDGTLKGESLAANSATFTDVTNTTLSDTLDIATDLSMTGNVASSVKNTKAGGTASVSGGTFSGDDFTANSATFTDVTNTTLSDTLDIATDLSMTGNVASSVKNTKVGGTASVSGGTFSGNNFTANSATFDKLSGLTLSGELESNTDISISSTAKGIFSMGATSAGSSLTVNGGTFRSTSLDTGTDAKFNNISAIGVSKTANIGGKLSITGSGTSSFGELTVGESVNVEGGAFKAGVITTGAKAESGGDVEITDASFSFGTDNTSRSTIHGSLVANQNSNSEFGDLQVDDAFQVSGGYVEGKSLHANSSIFTNNTVAYIDELILDGSGAPLDIEEGSIVTVGSITAEKGGAQLDTAGLIIVGEGKTSEIKFIDISEGVTVADASTVITGYVEGAGIGSVQDHIIAHRLIVENDENPASANIDVEDASITLTGIGPMRSEVGNNLIIHNNQQTSLGDIKVGGYVEIEGGSVKARQLDVAGDATFKSTSLDLAGTGASAGKIGGNLDLTDLPDSSIGDVAVNNDASISGSTIRGGALSAEGANISSASSVTLTELKTGAQGATVESKSDLAVNLLDIADSTLKVTDSSSVQVNADSHLANSGELNASKIEIDGGSRVTAQGSVSVDSAILDDGELSGASVTIAKELADMDEKSSIEATDGNIELKQGASGISGKITASAGTSGAAGGNILARDASNAFFDIIQQGELTLAAENNIEAKNIEVATLSTKNGSVISHEGSINISGSGSNVGGDLVAEANSKSSLGDITVGGATNFAKGELEAKSIETGSARLSDIKAAISELILRSPGAGNTLSVTATANANTFVNIDSLALNGGTLSVGGSVPATMVANAFSRSGGAIDGNIAISQNGRLILGARDLAFMDSPSSINPGANATFALAQTMRLGSGYGIHVTGSGQAAPVANQIRFDASSLFIIDGSNSSVRYVGNFIPSSQLAYGNGAVGALSADFKTVPATVDYGAQIYIRNPQAGTVIVALGENISTSYADLATSAQARADSAAPWTGVNLDYDNKDTVVVERLIGEYTGQFSVKPIDDTPVTPPDNPTPDNPNPPSPTPPDNPTPDNPNPPTPTTPDNPNPPSPTPPDNPTPDTPAPPAPAVPDEPDSPDPGEPDDPSPAPPVSPDTPVTPGTPSHPATPVTPHPGNTHPDAHPGIHETIKNETDKGNVGTEPHHLVTHHGAGLISHTLAHDNPREATQILESGLRMVILGAVSQLALTANDAASQAIQQRIDLLNMKQHSVNARSIALWAVPLYKTSTAWNMEAGAHDYDYHGGIGGVALGGDVTYEDIIRAGIAFNIGGGYSKSGGDLAETTNNMSFWGIGAYAGAVFGNFGVNADLNFTSSYNKLKQDISKLNGWQELKSDAQAYILGAGMNLEYRFQTDILDIIPHLGFKYHYIHVEDYDITHSGNTIIKGDAFNQNIWTFPMGIRFARDFDFESGWKLNPTIDLRVTPATGDIDARTTTRFTNTDLDVELHTKTMDYFTYGGTAGIEASIGDFAIGINYSVDVGSESMSNAIFATLRYEF